MFTSHTVIIPKEPVITGASTSVVTTSLDVLSTLSVVMTSDTSNISKYTIMY